MCYESSLPTVCRHSLLCTVYVWGKGVCKGAVCMCKGEVSRTVVMYAKKVEDRRMLQVDHEYEHQPCSVW